MWRRLHRDGHVRRCVVNMIASKRCSICKREMAAHQVQRTGSSASLTVYLCWECDRRKCSAGHVVRDGATPHCPTCGVRL